jgi:hypothetical protein
LGRDWRWLDDLARDNRAKVNGCVWGNRGGIGKCGIIERGVIDREINHFVHQQ